jgi:hypothetical protein
MTISPDKWEYFRDQIEDLYYVQKVPLKRVIFEMKAKGFRAR